MEFNEKLQDLRRQQGLSQEELAEALFVSRTAISKWESGRGYPNIESLKTIAAFFSVTIDDLLSGDEVLTIAEADNNRRHQLLRDMVFGLLDVGTALLLLLPLFGQTAEDTVYTVSLLALTKISDLLKIAYITAIGIAILLGLLTLALQNCRHALWVRCKSALSLAVNAASALLFIVSRQPYAATILFIYLVIKAVLMIKRR